jgi:hypothetical protein
VFIEKNIGKGNLVPVTGAGIDYSEKLWARVFDLIGTPVSNRVTKSSRFEGKLEGKVGGNIPLLAKDTLIYRPDTMPCPTE